jgi:DNA polymerase (family 10)
MYIVHLSMTNYEIADNFSMLSKLMDIHGEDSFKAKTYSITAFTIEKLPEELASLPPEKIFSIKGIGSATGKKILEQIQTGRLEQLDAILEKTPAGILEMMHIKGLGPKKIAVIWKEMEIETLGELLYACTENRLARYKGFGDKTQLKIKEGIEFYFNSQGQYLYSQVETYASTLNEHLAKAFNKQQFLQTGDFRRQLNVIDKLEWVTDTDPSELEEHFSENGFTIEEASDSKVVVKTAENLELHFYYSDASALSTTLFTTSCSQDFLNAAVKKFNLSKNYSSEQEIFSEAKLPFIPACLREDAGVLEKDLSKLKLIEPSDVKAIIHSHSRWSDGVEHIADMAKACIDIGYEYLVISDHSKTAAYAQGLTEERIIAQQGEIDELNKKFAPFRIFKSVESDILGDGSLDYDDEMLATFDLVIASVHANLTMNEEKAMMRLINAIENPFTSILGHMTGRLLLSRNGYPVDHKKIIDACAANNVVIEINAHPRRLDMDWKWIDHALNKGVLLSIDPDAHSIDEYDNIKYGVLTAQKGGLTAAIISVVFLCVILKIGWLNNIRKGHEECER